MQWKSTALLLATIFLFLFQRIDACTPQPGYSNCYEWKCAGADSVYGDCNTIIGTCSTTQMTSPCVTGMRTRNVRCFDKNNLQVSNSNCLDDKPWSMANCFSGPQCSFNWLCSNSAGQAVSCDVYNDSCASTDPAVTATKCFTGLGLRNVKCYSSTNVEAIDNDCSYAPKPTNTPVCTVTEGCVYDWKCAGTDNVFGDCSTVSSTCDVAQASGTGCDLGSRTRAVKCHDQYNKEWSDGSCSTTKPWTQVDCAEGSNCTYDWVCFDENGTAHDCNSYSGTCTADDPAMTPSQCYTGLGNRRVECAIAFPSNEYFKGDETECAPVAKPTTTPVCKVAGGCSYVWKCAGSDNVFGDCDAIMGTCDITTPTTTCSSGTRSRTVQCFDQNGAAAADEDCAAVAEPKPWTQENCYEGSACSFGWTCFDAQGQPEACNAYSGACVAADPGMTSSQCYVGTGNRDVKCVEAATGLNVPDGECSSTPKPTMTPACKVTEGCVYDWKCTGSDNAFGDCDAIMGTCDITTATETCSSGTRSRTVQCFNQNGVVTADEDCVAASKVKPWTQENCYEGSACSFGWTCFDAQGLTESCDAYSGACVAADPSMMSSQCYTGTGSRDVKCVEAATGLNVPDGECAPAIKPTMTPACSVTVGCSYEWKCAGINHVFGDCDVVKGICDITTATATCSAGTRSRAVRCVNQSGTVVADEDCIGASKPKPWTQQSCYEGSACAFGWTCFDAQGQPEPCDAYSGACVATDPGMTSSQCYTGRGNRDVKCVEAATGWDAPESECSSTPKPTTTPACKVTDGCSYDWKCTVDEGSSFSECTEIVSECVAADSSVVETACYAGTATRLVQCLDQHGAEAADDQCPPDTKPTTVSECEVKSGCNGIWVCTIDDSSPTFGVPECSPTDVTAGFPSCRYQEVPTRSVRCVHPESTPNETLDAVCFPPDKPVVTNEDIEDCKGNAAEGSTQAIFRIVGYALLFALVLLM